MTPLHNTPIQPLVRRHAQDAAWYHGQLEADRLSPVVDAQRAAHYRTLLSCHLEGLAVAETVGWTLAMAELKRWQDRDSLFVGWWLALHTPMSERTAAVLAFMDKIPDADECAASALAWSTQERGKPWLQTWLHGDDPRLLRVALLACAQTGQKPDLPLAPLCRSAHAGLVQAVCRVIGALRMEELRDQLLAAGRFGHPAVREAAGVALLACGRAVEAVPLLREAMLLQHADAVDDTGGQGLVAEHRAQVLACLYGTAVGHVPPYTAAVSEIPTYLLPLFLSHRGHADGLGLLANLMESPHGTAALRAVCRLTGLDAEAEGLCLPSVLPDSPAFDDETPEYAGRGLDSGLPAPDVHKVLEWIVSRQGSFLAGVPLLQGQEANQDCCRNVLATGMQDERFAAAWRLAQLHSAPTQDTTGPATLWNRVA